MYSSTAEAISNHSISEPSSPAEVAVIGDIVLEPGARIEHYEILRRIGRGGMGLVFLARDTRLARLVAIKFLRYHSKTDASRFLSEARMTARCRHENIVVIHHVDEIGGYPYMVLEYVEGKPFRQVIEEESNGMTISRALELMAPVLRAVICAHSMGIIHRDLKPENLLLAENGTVKVVDFGISTNIIPHTAGAIVENGGLNEDGLVSTQTGAFVGTMPYMSPEQWRQEVVDEATDIWALGLILFELLTGSHPFGTCAMRELSTVKLDDIPMPSLYERRADAGPVIAIVDRCLKKRKADRYASVAELQEALEAVARESFLSLGETGGCPFSGLAPFQETDAMRFFGREKDVFAVMNLLRHQEVVLVAGRSGAGKSSFVRAGIVPAFKRFYQDTMVFVIRPGRRPLVALAEILLSLHEPRAEIADASAMANRLKEEPGYLGTTLRALARSKSNETHILLFVDQLEEIFTLGVDLHDRNVFLSCLEGVADDASSPLRVIAAMRTDFLDRGAEDQLLSTFVSRGLFLLPQLGHDALARALMKPAEMMGYRFEDETLVEEMIAEIEGSPSALPLLQFAATKLWESRDDERRVLSRAAYAVQGGVVGALSAHADAVFLALSLPEQRLARGILMRLVTPERTRAIVSMDELMGTDEDVVVEQILNKLVDARLVAIDVDQALSDPESREKTIELTHESLIERWARLAHWLGENEQDARFLAQLRNAAANWERNQRSEGLLWRDEAAKVAERWFENHERKPENEGTISLADREERYLHAVVSLARRARRWRMRFAFMITMGLVTFTVVVTILAIRARDQANRADTQAKIANEEARVARNATRIAAARQLSRDHTMTLALIREIEEPGVPRGWDELAWSSLGSDVCPMIYPIPTYPHSIELSPDGRRVAIALKDGSTWIASVDGTSPPWSVAPHNAPTTTARWHPDGHRIATTFEDGTIRIVDIDGALAPVVLNGHTGKITNSAWSPDGKRFATTSLDETARIWDPDGQSESIVFRGHEGAVMHISWSADGQRIATSSEDSTGRIWNANGSGNPVVLRGHDYIVNTMMWSRDNQRVVTASHDKTARIWNADGNGTPIVLRGHEGAVLAAHWTHDDERIFTVSRDHTARLWNADGTGNPRVYSGHQEEVLWAALSPDGRRALTGGGDGVLRIFTLEGDTAEMVLWGHRRKPFAAGFTPDGQSVISTSWDLTVRFWTLAGVLAPEVRLIHPVNITSARWSPDGKRFLTTSDDHTARLTPVDGLGESIIFRGHEDKVNHGAFSPDGTRIVTAADDGTCRVWNADNGELLFVFRDHEASVRGIMFSPDGLSIVSTSDDKTARIWSADGTGITLVLRGHEGRVRSGRWSHDGTRVVTSSDDLTVRIWSADGTGEPRIFKGHEDHVRWADFSSDDTRIVSAAYDDTVRVWNVDGSGDPIVLQGLEEAPNWATFSPDGKRVIAAAQDKTIRVWNVDDRESTILHRGPAWFKIADLSADGKRLIAPAHDGTVFIWSNVEPIRGPNDPRLWTSSSYCLPPEDRLRILGVTAQVAKDDYVTCLRRVEQARRESTGPR